MTKNITILLTGALALYILSPYLPSIGMGAIFAMLFYSWMKRIEPRKFPNSLAAGLITVSVSLLILMPLGAMTFIGAKSGLNELQQIKRMENMPNHATSDEVLDNVFVTLGIGRGLEKAALLLPIDPVQATEQLKDFIGILVVKLGTALSVFISQLPTMVVALAVFILSMYYFLADGAHFLQIIRRSSFFAPVDTERLITSFSELCHSVILASIASGAAQAFLAMCVSLFVGIKQFPIVFVMVFIASFIPLIGAFPVIMSIALYQFIAGNNWAGFILAGSAAVIGVVDNIIRPWVIRGNANLHPLLGFASALGGLQVFGMSGVFLGPVICGVFIKMIEIKYKQL